MSEPTQLIIREVAVGERSACAKIYADAWNGALPNAHRVIDFSEFEKEIDGEITYVAAVGECIRGYISIWEPDWFVHHLYIDPEAQGFGIGKALILHFEKLAGAQPLSLKCQIANTGALGFYASLGFVATSERGKDEFGSWVHLEKRRDG